MSKKLKAKKKNTQSGLITLDFIFAFTLAFGFCSVLFAICVMLSMVEVTQYITYSTSRAYNGAHETPELQAELAKAKYSELLAIPVFRRIFGMRWVNLPKEPELGDFSSEYPVENPDRDFFVGARVAIDANILHLSVPFLGSTTKDSNVGKAKLNSYLLREVSTSECRELFNKDRYEKLKSLDSAYAQAQSSKPAALITDNGC